MNLQKGGHVAGITEEPKQVDLKHEHDWVKSKDDHDGEWPFWYCAKEYKGGSCRTLKVTAEEFKHRTEAWNSYLDLTRTSDAYRDFMEMKEAYFASDEKRIKEILARVSKRTKLETDEAGNNEFSHMVSEYMPMPEFPDPMKPWAYFVEVK